MPKPSPYPPDWEPQQAHGSPVAEAVWALYDTYDIFRAHADGSAPVTSVDASLATQRAAGDFDVHLAGRVIPVQVLRGQETRILYLERYWLTETP